MAGETLWFHEKHRAQRKVPKKRHAPAERVSYLNWVYLKIGGPPKNGWFPLGFPLTPPNQFGCPETKTPPSGSLNAGPPEVQRPSLNLGRSIHRSIESERCRRVGSQWSGRERWFLVLQQWWITRGQPFFQWVERLGCSAHLGSFRIGLTRGLSGLSDHCDTFRNPLLWGLVSGPFSCITEVGSTSHRSVYKRLGRTQS